MNTSPSQAPKQPTLLVSVLVFFAVSSGSILWRAFVIVKLCEWFVEPITGFTAWSVPLAAGWLLLVTLLTRQEYIGPNTAATYADKVIRSVVDATLTPAVWLFFGWLFTFFLA